MDDLARIRSQAVGQEADEALLAQYPVKEQRELMIPTRHGQVKVYLYRPFSSKKTLPVLINFHGGGFVKGYRGRDIGFSRIAAARAECIVLDVDYKIAPEYKYPYAVEEGYDLYLYVKEHAGEFGGEKDKIAFSGASAGANMATVITMMLKKAGQPLPLCVVSCYPPYDLFTDPGEKMPGEDPERVKTGRLYNSWYADENVQNTSCVSPVFAAKEELEGLPPFTIIAAEKDSLCKEALTFASMLADAGVTVTARKIQGAKHGFLVRRTQGFELGEELLFGTLNYYFQ